MVGSSLTAQPETGLVFVLVTDGTVRQQTCNPLISAAGSALTPSSPGNRSLPRCVAGVGSELSPWSPINPLRCAGSGSKARCWEEEAAACSSLPIAWLLLAGAARQRLSLVTKPSRSRRQHSSPRGKQKARPHSGRVPRAAPPV